MKWTWLNRIKAPESASRAVLVLISGTAFAHVITALALPLLTRLYSPDDFSLLAVFSSSLSIISIAVCLRFDVAIPMPELDSDAFNLLTLALTSTLVVTIVLGMLVLIAPAQILIVTRRLELAPYLWLLPVGTLLAGTYSALTNWFIREREFSLIAQSRVVQSAASASTQIGTAGLGIGPVGLLAGYLLNTGAACIALGYKLLRQKKFSGYIHGLSYSKLKITWAEYSLFPKYSTWEALANSAAIQVPIIMIAAITATAEAGYLLLAMSVIQAPMALFGTAIGQVYLSRAPDAYRQGRLGIFTAEILSKLIRAGAGPLLAIGILSPIAFGTVFGDGWERAGWLVAWMTPWFIMQFLATPLSMAIHVTGHQRAALILQIFGLSFRVLSVWGAAQLANGPVSEAYAISGGIFYLIYLWLIMRCVEYNSRATWLRTIRDIGVLAVWLFIALLLSIAGLYIPKALN